MSKKSENHEMSSNLFELIEKANRFEVLGKNEEAIKFYEESLTIETREEILIQLGYIYHRIGSLDNSIKYFVKAVEMNPKSAMLIMVLEFHITGKQC